MLVINLYHNKRFPQIWDIISKEIDFTNTTIIDVGCGYGDFAIAASQDAKVVYAIDYDTTLTARLAAKVTGKYDNILVCQDDMNNWNFSNYPEVHHSPTRDKIDILSCFSVLPYLDNPTELLRLFRIISRMVLIECQYFGDGPGFEHIKHNGDMLKWLKLCGYTQCDVLGKTFVSGRDKYRTIWRCS